MVSKFQAGDLVATNRFYGDSEDAGSGEVGVILTVVNPDDGSGLWPVQVEDYTVENPGPNDVWYFVEDELDLVEP